MVESKVRSPKVSLIVPSYNHQDYIGILIHSIYQQTFRDFELIVLDDGSKDDSPRVLSDLQQIYGFKLVLKANEGVCRTLNQGIELARGEYFTAIASDDFIPPYRLQEQVRYLEANKDADVVAGSMLLVDMNGKACGLRVPGILGDISLNQMLKTNRVHAPTVMLRRNVFDRFGQYREDHLIEDYYLWIKILKHGGKIHNVSNIWAYYRITNVDLEKKYNLYYKGAEQVFAEYASEPLIVQQARTNVFIYCIKMSLLLGKPAIEKYSESISKLNYFESIAIYAISKLPGHLRNLILLKLKLKT